MPAAAAPVIWGAGVGAGVTAISGGDPLKGALYGAIGGGIGGAINPYSFGGSSMIASSATVGGIVGGAAGGAYSITKPGLIPMPGKPPMLPPSPSSVRVQAASAAEREARRKRRGYGSTMLTGGELGTATTTRKQILG